MLPFQQRPKTEPGIGICCIQFQRASIALGCGNDLFEFAQSISKVKVGLRSARVQGNGRPIAFGRLRKSKQIFLGIAQIIIGFKKRGLISDCLFKMGNSFFTPAHFTQSNAQMIVGVRKTGLSSHRLLQQLDGAGILAPCNLNHCQKI